jgi:MATE family multidrug resistance protein
MDILYIFKDEKVRAMIKNSWSISWPMSCIMFFMFLIGLADVYVAGRVGKEVQAAYGLANQIYFVFSIVVFALTVGSVSVVSRLFTAEKKEEFTIAVDSSLIIAGISGLALSIIGVWFSSAIIAAFHIPEVLKELSLPLVRIYNAGLLFSYLFVNTNGILRACGQIRLSLITVSIASVLNVILNFFLAFKTSLGYQGIAVATVISMFVGAVLNLIFIRNRAKGVFKFSFATARKIFAIGWPAGFHQILWQTGAMVLFLILGALPRHNIEVMAAFTNGLKIESAIFLPAFAFNLANAVIIGNLLGRKESARAFTAGIVTAAMGVCIVLIMSLIIFLNVRSIAAFLSNNDIVIGESIRYILIMLVAEPFMAWGIILAGGLNGAGDTRSVMFITAFSIWAVRVPLSYFLGIRLGMGAVSVWWMMNLSILVQSFFISKRYFSRRWLVRADAVHGYSPDAGVAG